MYTIRKTFDFSASHQLEHLPLAHKCARLHGHNYRVEVVLSAIGLNDKGFVQDYAELDDIKQFLDNKLDHRHLNDIFNFPTTAEHLASYLFIKFQPDHPRLSAVRVSETPKTWAEYTP